MLEREIELIEIDRRPLAGPFPNLHVREVVKGVVFGIVETVGFCTMTPTEQSHFALGYVRGAMTTLRQTGDDLTLPFVADILDRLNNNGIEAVRRLIEIVIGREAVIDEPDTAAAA